MEGINDYFDKNYKLIESISKRVLKGRFREGISAYYMYLYDRDTLPTNIATNVYYYMVNMSKPNSEINYSPVTLKGSINEDCHITTNIEDKIDLQIDLEDERLVDFLLNNEQTDKWIKIYEVIYLKKIELDLYESIIFDYVFSQGLSIRQIAALTNNSPSWIYKQRKAVIDKIKKAINEKVL